MTIARNDVGPVLSLCSESEPVLAAIENLNEKVRFVTSGSYVRVLVPDCCVLTKSAVEEVLGDSFQWPGQLEMIMPSFKGRLEIFNDIAIWSVGNR